MLLFGEFQRAGGWCKPVRKKESSLIPELTLRRVYLRSGVRLPRYRLWTYFPSPRETVRCKAAVNKVVPRINYSSLRQSKASRIFLVPEKKGETYYGAD